LNTLNKFYESGAITGEEHKNNEYLTIYKDLTRIINHIIIQSFTKEDGNKHLTSRWMLERLQTIQRSSVSKYIKSEGQIHIHQSFESIWIIITKDGV